MAKRQTKQRSRTATKAAKTQKITDRQRLLVDYLPEHNWQYSLAGLAAGYSRAYATTTLSTVVKKNASLCKLIDEKRREISAGTIDIREKRLEQLRERIDACPNKDNTTFVRLVDQEAKFCNWHITTINMESNARQSELDSVRIEEVRRLALLRHTALPSPRIEDTVLIDANSDDDDVVSLAADTANDNTTHDSIIDSDSDSDAQHNTLDADTIDTQMLQHGDTKYGDTKYGDSHDGGDISVTSDNSESIVCEKPKTPRSFG